MRFQPQDYEEILHGVEASWTRKGVHPCLGESSWKNKGLSLKFELKSSKIALASIADLAKHWNIEKQRETPTFCVIIDVLLIWVKSPD